MSDKKYVGSTAAAKLVSLVKSALKNKADKTNATASAAGLMSAADKSKLDGISEGATRITVDSEISASSANPVMNGTIAVKLSGKADKTDLDYKLDKAGGTITGNLTVNGDFEPVKGITTSGGVYAQTVSTPVLDLHDNGTAAANASINVSGVGAVEVTVPDGDKRSKARLKIGTPTEDNDAATKKYVDDHGAANAVLYTTQELTYNQKFQARKNIGAAASEVPTITGGVSLCPANVTDSNTAVHTTTTTASGDDFTLALDGGPENVPVRVKGIRTPTGAENDAAANVEYVKNSIPTALKNPNALTIKVGSTTATSDASAAKTVTIADGREVAY